MRGGKQIKIMPKGAGTSAVWIGAVQCFSPSYMSPRSGIVCYCILVLSKWL